MWPWKGEKKGSKSKMKEAMKRVALSFLYVL